MKQKLKVNGTVLVGDEELSSDTVAQRSARIRVVSSDNLTAFSAYVEKAERKRGYIQPVVLTVSAVNSSQFYSKEGPVDASILIQPGAQVKAQIVFGDQKRLEIFMDNPDES